MGSIVRPVDTSGSDLRPRFLHLVYPDEGGGELLVRP